MRSVKGAEQAERKSVQALEAERAATLQERFDGQLPRNGQLCGVIDQLRDQILRLIAAQEPTWLVALCPTTGLMQVIEAVPPGGVPPDLRVGVQALEAERAATLQERLLDPANQIKAELENAGLPATRLGIAIKTQATAMCAGSRAEEFLWLLCVNYSRLSPFFFSKGRCNKRGRARVCVTCA